MEMIISVLGLIASSFAIGFLVGKKQHKPINFIIKDIKSDVFQKGWNMVTFFPKHPIEIKEGKECVLYLGIKE